MSQELTVAKPGDIGPSELTCADCQRATALFLHVARGVFLCIDCHPCADHHPLIPLR